MQKWSQRSSPKNKSKEEFLATKQITVLEHPAYSLDLNSGPLLVILAKYWLWLPDDGFFVNRNMSEQPL